MHQNVKCGFCKTGDETTEVCGSLYTDTLNGKLIAAHHKCMKYSALLVQYKTEVFGGFRIHEVQKELKRGAYLKCEICKSTKTVKKERMSGATAGCAVDACRKTFHYYCVSTHPYCVTKRYEVPQGKNIVIKYRVFCSKAHEEYYRSHVKAEDVAKRSQESSESKDDNADDDASDSDSDVPNNNSEPEVPVPDHESNVPPPQQAAKIVTNESRSGASSRRMSSLEVVSAYHALLVRNGTRRSPRKIRSATPTMSPKMQSPVNGKRAVTETEVNKDIYMSPTKQRRRGAAGDDRTTRGRESVAMATGDSWDNVTVDFNTSNSRRANIEGETEEAVPDNVGDSWDNVTEDFNTSNSCGANSDGETEKDVPDTWSYVVPSRLELDDRDMKRVCDQVKVAREKAILWPSMGKQEGLTDDHLPFIMWDIASKLQKGDTDGLFKVLFEPDIQQYDWLVKFHSESRQLGDTQDATLEAIRGQLGRLNKKLRHEAGHLVRVGGSDDLTHVLVFSLSKSIDKNHLIRTKLRENVYQWSKDSLVSKRLRIPPDAVKQSKLLIDWLLTKVKNNFEMERYPKENTLHSQRMVSDRSVSALVAAGMETASQNVLTMASAKLLVVESVDKEVIRYKNYVHKLVCDFVRRNDGFECFCMFDVGGEDTDLQCVKDIVPSRVWSRSPSVYSAFSPQHVPVSCLVIRFPGSNTDPESQSLPSHG